VAGATVAVVNPRSADGATGRRWDKTARLLHDGIGPFETVFTSGPEMATRVTRAALREGAALIVAVGGDGTLNEVTNGFFDESGHAVSPEAALGLLPAGTGGDFRRSVGIPLDTEAAVRILAGESRLVDVGKVTYRAHDGGQASRFFINVASCGVSGLVDRYVNRSTKRLGGKISFALASLRSLGEYRDRHIRLQLDGGAWEEMAITSLAVANGQYFGGGMWVAPKAALDDGIFDVTIWTGFGFRDFVFKSAQLYDGRHLRLPGVTTARARTVVAQSEEEVLLDLDGEQPGRLPATWEVIPRALRLRGIAGSPSR
jgi:YegS/Rv2252/BmrU family lipid kinase